MLILARSRRRPSLESPENAGRKALGDENLPPGGGGSSAASGVVPSRVPYRPRYQQRDVFPFLCDSIYALFHRRPLSVRKLLPQALIPSSFLGEGG